MKERIRVRRRARSFDYRRQGWPAHQVAAAEARVLGVLRSARHSRIARLNTMASMRNRSRKASRRASNRDTGPKVDLCIVVEKP